MEKLSTPVIADSSALVSLASQADANHQQAVTSGQALRAAHRPIILCGDVLSETLNIVGKKLGRDLQLTIAADLLNSGSFLYIPTSDEGHRRALALLKKQPASVSFTDCIVMALADTYDTRDVFGFDQDFEAAGYRLPPFA